MLPKFHTGLFLTLSLLLARRADAEMKEFKKLNGQFLEIAAMICIQDNTWDIAVADHLQTPDKDFSQLNFNSKNTSEAGLDFQTFGILLPASSQNLTKRTLSPPGDNRLSGGFSRPLFHPPSRMK